MIGFGIGDALQAAEDSVRRNWKSKAVRAAEKRRSERRSRESWLKARRAFAFGGVSAAGALGTAVVLGALAMAPVAAAAAGVAGLAVSGLLPPRKPAARLSREELAALPSDAEEWLLDQRLLLPPEAAPSYDAILDLLGDLPPRLARLEPNATLAWESRRLIGDHLPTLVRSYCGLPAAVRERDPEPRRRLVDGLETIAAELTRLCEEASRDERMLLETRQRYLDSRYRDGLSSR